MTKSLFIGRFKPFHEGHQAIVDKLKREGHEVIIGVRPEKGKYSKTKGVKLPEFDEIVYGREVGYKMREVKLDPAVEQISATNIRKSKVWWITGNTGAGKTTLALRIKNTINLDGDAMRKVWKLGFSKEDRYEQNLRVARLAKLLSTQGYDVVVSTICPYKDLREKVREICHCKFVFLEGGKESSKKYPYEK